MKPQEYAVYTTTINLLKAHTWRIVCACPPGGTDNRYRKCLLPRRSLSGSEKGPRDEIDVIAVRGRELFLIECKATLSDSLTIRNSLGETDLDKLYRIRSTLGPGTLASLLSQATGVAVPLSTIVGIGIAVAKMDVPLPNDMTLFSAPTGHLHLCMPPPAISVC